VMVRGSLVVVLYAYSFSFSKSRVKVNLRTHPLIVLAIYVDDIPSSRTSSTVLDLQLHMGSFINRPHRSSWDSWCDWFYLLRWCWWFKKILWADFTDGSFFVKDVVLYGNILLSLPDYFFLGETIGMIITTEAIARKASKLVRVSYKRILTTVHYRRLHRNRSLR
jgi:hypothetical protein